MSRNNILPDYMENKNMEVVDILMTLFSGVEVQKAFMRSERKVAKLAGSKKAELLAMPRDKEEAKKFLAKMRNTGLREKNKSTLF